MLYLDIQFSYGSFYSSGYRLCLNVGKSTNSSSLQKALKHPLVQVLELTALPVISGLPIHSESMQLYIRQRYMQYLHNCLYRGLRIRLLECSQTVRLHCWVCLSVALALSGNVMKHWSNLPFAIEFLLGSRSLWHSEE